MLWVEWESDVESPEDLSTHWTEEVGKIQWKREKNEIKGKQTAEKSENKTCYFGSALCSCQLVEDILIKSRISQVLTCKRRFFQIW